MPLPLSHAVPLLAALGYGVAALLLKRATENGAGPWRVSFITNWVMTAFFSLLWLLPSPHPASWENVAHAFIAGALFFIGQIFTFLALSRGDVSTATPILGAKVVFVALFTVLLGAARLTPGVWLAVILTAAATALLGGGGRSSAVHSRWRGLIYGFCAASTFALTDVLQQGWIKLWGLPHFAATLFISVALCSLALIPFFHGSLGSLSPAGWRWSLAGGAVLSVQAFGVVWSIFTLGATTTNVLYNSRGIWSVILVWTIGHWFGNTERAQGRAIFVRRLVGSALLLLAIVLIGRQPVP